MRIENGKFTGDTGSVRTRDSSIKRSENTSGDPADVMVRSETSSHLPNEGVNLYAVDGSPKKTSTSKVDNSAPEKIGASTYDANSSDAAFSKTSDPNDKTKIPNESKSYNTGETITILHTNDIHGETDPHTDKKSKDKGDIGGLGYLGSVIREEKAKDPDGTLLLDAGDISTGGAVSDYFKALPIVDVMNELGYDAMTVGNHEFDSGRLALVEIADRAKFPILSANLVDNAPGKKIEVKPYVMKDVEGFKVGILGLTTPESFSMLTKEDAEQIRFLSVEDTAKTMISRMKGEGAELIVVLSHLGIEDDRKLAESVKGIDVIVGGHSHTETPEPVKIGNTIIVQSGTQGENLGKIDLNITHDKKGAKILNANFRLIPIKPDNIKPDGEVSGIVKKYADRLAPVLKREIGEAKVPLTRRDYHIYMEESNLGNLVTDIIRKKAGADVGILAPSALRSTIPQGVVKIEQIFELFPWKNKIVTLQMQGKDIKKVLGEFLSGPALGFTVSGINVEFDKSKPDGERITSITMPDGKEMDPEKTYKIATRDFYADGKLGLETFKNGKNRQVIADLQDTLVDRFESMGDIMARTDGRIKNIGPETAFA